MRQYLTARDSTIKYIRLDNFDIIRSAGDDANDDAAIEQPEHPASGSSSPFFTCLGDKQVLRASERLRYLIHFSTSVTNVYWYHFLKHRWEGFQIPSLFVDFKIMQSGLLVDLRLPLDSGVATIGSLVLSLKRQANKLLNAALARTVVRCRSILRIENLKVQHKLQIEVYL